MDLHIDLETYSSVNIKKSGAYRYVEAPDFRILLFGYAINEHPVRVVDLEHGEDLSDDVIKHILNPNITKYAHNANFERLCLSKHFDKPMPPEQWRCTVAWARSLALPGSLDALGAFLGFPEDKVKSKNGLRLIKMFCTPGKKQLSLDGKDWTDFIEYCRQDVEAERAVHKYLSKYPLPDSEWALWALDQKINDRGLLVDLRLAAELQRIETGIRELLTERIKDITGVSNPNSRDQLLPWLHVNGLALPDLTAETVNNCLTSRDMTENTREVLKARQQLARTSLAKLDALYRTLTSGDRIRGAFMFHGATTGRWTGKGFQPHNLPRPIIEQDEIPMARQLALDGCEAETWALLYADPMGALASLIRPVIAPATGKLTVADLSSIESVMAAWVAGSKKLVELFRGGRDPYKDFASKLYGIPYEEVTKKQRTICKPVVLGRQYGMGAAGLCRYAESMGMDLALHEAQAQIKVWNKNHGDIMTAWKDIQEAALESIRNPGAPSGAGRCKFRRDTDFLMIWLPSGRRLHYYGAKETQGNYGVEIAYQDRRKGWIRTFGARLFENIVQAVARDVLTAGMINADAAGMDLIGHIHDEIITEGDNLPELIAAMVAPPAWCPDAPIRAEGYVGDFYRKD